MLKNYYRNFGDVRGECPHRHRTLTGAMRCNVQDQRGCASQGGYTDRMIYRITPHGAALADLSGEVFNG